MFTSLTPERQNLEVVPLQNECLAHETAPIFNCFFEKNQKKKTTKQNKIPLPFERESGGHYDSPFSFGM